MTPAEHPVDAGGSLCPRTMRRLILEQSMRAGVGHIGSSLSVVEILSALYGGVLRIPSPDDAGRDRFVLSKGHAALALYAALHLRGWIPAEELATFCGSGTLLGVHPEHQLRGVDFSTGSLGMGLGFAAGSALAARMQGRPARAFALLSDAECNEGSVWEAAMFAAHHRLSNLVAVIDANGQQALGYTDEVLDPGDLPGRWETFGWDVHCVDGHDLAALGACFARLDYGEGRPHLVFAQTTFGKGVSFMERAIKWHYWPMNESEYRLALAEIGGGGAA
jgi:transketolase